MPTWGADLSGLIETISTSSSSPTEQRSASWDEVPGDIKRTFDRLGIPEADAKFLAGAGAQYDSEMVYHQIRKELEAQGVIFKSIPTRA
ncbi:MAG: hypothetical protein KatS3mg051_0550 [Anaerolineae bacterium]|nr:MAG: hypothetical protein KatS3mg051_0550 [Anaerolineae bacterium]